MLCSINLNDTSIASTAFSAIFVCTHNRGTDLER